MPNCTAVDEVLQRELSLETPCFVEQLLPQLVDLVRAAKRLPVGEEHAIRRGSREFSAGVKELGQRCLGTAHRTLRFLDQATHAESNSEALSNFNVIVDSIDNVLERVDICLQDALAGHRATASSEPGLPAWAQRGAGAQALSHPGAASGPKPQVRWRQLVDNERTSFVPRIIVKHNQQAPLAADIVQAQCRAGLRPRVARAAGTQPQLAGEEERPLPHPYEAELGTVSWDGGFFEMRRAARYLRMEDTPLVMVSTEQELREMIQEIKATCVGKEIAVDVEHHDFRSYRGFVCLVQISTRQKDFVVDPFDIFSQMHLLNEVFTDPSIVKVLHGADKDVTWLQRDFSVYFVNMFDTGQATRVLRLPGGFSLANLVAHFCGVKLDKKYQTADWRERPLPPEMLEYARCDTHYLLYCYDRLKNALLAHTGSFGAIASSEGDDLQVTDLGLQALNTVLQKSAELCRQLYAEAPFDAEGTALQLCQRFGSQHRPLEAKQLMALRALLVWRDRLARSADESCHFVAPDACLWRIALAMPPNASRLRSACNPLPATVQAHAQEVVDIVSRPTEPAPGEAAAGADAAVAPGGAALLRGTAPATAAHDVPAAPVAQLQPAAAAAAGAAVPVAMAVTPRPAWPVRRKGWPQPLVRVAAAADAEGGRRLRACGSLGALLSTLVRWERDAEGDAAQAAQAQDAEMAEAAPAAKRLRSIEGAMSFVAAPPAAPPAAAFAAGTAGAAGAPENGTEVQVVEEDDEDPLANLSLLQRKKRRQAPVGKCLENVVRAGTALAPPGASLGGDPSAQLAATAAAVPKPGEVAGARPKKKKKVKRVLPYTSVDPYL